jgi:hypothetical protein
MKVFSACSKALNGIRCSSTSDYIDISVTAMGISDEPSNYKETVTEKDENLITSLVSHRRRKKHFPWKQLIDEEGSASVELVIFAMPLFIPLLMLASHALALSASKIETSHLARTALRAFVSAPSTPLGHARVQQVLMVAERQLDVGYDARTRVKGSIFDSVDFPRFTTGSSRMTYLIECRRQPCIQPSNRVRITLKDHITGVEVVATLHTDQWIQGEAGFTPDESGGLFGYRDIAEIEEEIAPILELKDFVDQGRELLDVITKR